MRSNRLSNIEYETATGRKPDHAGRLYPSIGRG